MFHTLLSTVIHFPWIKIGYAVAIYLIFFIIQKIFTGYFLKIILKLTTKTKSNLDDQVINSFKGPLNIFILLLGLYFGFRELPFTLHTQTVFNKMIRSLFVIIIGWGFINLTAVTHELFSRVGKRFNIKFDQILIPFLTKFFKFVIIALVFTIVAGEWGFNINGFITGLGLGGLAVALAARDTLSNLFGGMVIITENPFTIGDWIKTPSVEGTVEDITFRSTKIRTFSQALVTVPNSTLANEPITNWSKMGKRRITFNLKLNIHTPREKIVTCTNEISDMLKNNEAIDEETIFVNFSDFSTSSLDLFLYFFTKTTNWEIWLKIKEEVNLQIMEILEKNKVEIALPAQHLYYKNDPFKEIEENKPSFE